MNSQTFESFQKRLAQWKKIHDGDLIVAVKNVIDSRSTLRFPKEYVIILILISILAILRQVKLWMLILKCFQLDFWQRFVFS